jgi:hypothetical protein
MIGDMWAFGDAAEPDNAGIRAAGSGPGCP